MGGIWVSALAAMYCRTPTHAVVIGFIGPIFTSHRLVKGMNISEEYQICYYYLQIYLCYI